jgi:hypothetical protein
MCENVASSSNMASIRPSRAEIADHLKELDWQAREARLALEQPEIKPGTHKQLRRLLSRISKEKAGLIRATAKVYGTKE